MLYVQGAIWGLLGALKMKISRINKKILHGRNGII